LFPGINNIWANLWHAICVHYESVMNSFPPYEIVAAPARRMTSQGALMRGSSRWLLCPSVLLPAGCQGMQSALDPAGREAEQIALLFWWMVGGVTVIWFGVMGLTLYCVRSRPETFNHRKENWIIVGGGAVFPTLVLALLLVFGLAMLPGLLKPASAGSVIVAVDGEMWWWRVRYPAPGGETIVLANEIHLPVGETVEFQLQSDNVIHSFWIPSLGGKVDMLPGRGTRLALTPTRTGLFRGVCAEYCGASHAFMQFDVIVESRDAFDRWLRHQATPAVKPNDPVEVRGERAFVAHGCGACHAVRGTSADGVIGPDLTHVGSRRSLAAATLPNEIDHFKRWIAHTDDVKPESRMPRFSMLPDDELLALAAYLKGLK
jgi:cytochrome c oxidase subunit 2